MKIFKHNIIATALLAFSVLSCDKAESPVSIPEQTVTMNYSVALDQQTKALGEGNSVNYIWCGAYVEANNQGNTTYTLISESLTKVTDASAQCQIELLREQTYKVVFVGQHYESTDQEPRPTYDIAEADALIYMPAQAVTNSDNYDLFTYVDSVIDFEPSLSKNITLSRQVAQINFIASDMPAVQASGNIPESSSVTLTSVPKYINLFDGTVSDEKIEVNYTPASLINSGENPLASVFCLASRTKVDVQASLYIYIGEVEQKRYTSVSLPCKANYKTNVMVTYTNE